uniref:Uncharacterized protein n=1 Tax=Vitis vinifera TaxID=29760 RepID=F6HXC4_VITVI
MDEKGHKIVIKIYFFCDDFNVPMNKYHPQGGDLKGIGGNGKVKRMHGHS